jgi:hypothetical protein
MNINDRMQLLENSLQAISAYSLKDGQYWRPGIVDLFVYDTLMSMHESDYAQLEPEPFWTKTPDEIMQHIVETEKYFDLEGGAQDLWEELRDYLTDNGFNVDPQELTDEQYQKLLEGN